METGRTEWPATVYTEAAPRSHAIEIPAEVIYCERCFSLGKCPTDARREQTTIDNPNVNVLCCDCLAEPGVAVQEREVTHG